MIALHGLKNVCTLGCLLALVACSNGRGSLGGGEQQAPSRVTIGGTITGLAGSGLVLQNNGADELSIATNGTFRFSTPVDPGAAYNVTVRTQPSNPAQGCAVANATGVAGAANVTSVAVNCAAGLFSIGGSVSGLAGSGLVLRNNGGEDLSIASNGSFTFTTQFANGAAYAVTIAVQPGNPAQTCTIANGSGTVAGANVGSITVTCATSTFAIRGSVSGLEGRGLVLQNNGGDDIGIESSGGFTFPTALASGAAYQVTVKSQPSNPTQACTVQNDTGTVAGAEISNIVVTCSTREFTIGGTVSALAGSGLILSNNGADPLPINTNGSFTFPTAVLSGRPYNVTVSTQPRRPTQVCSISNPAGTVTDHNVIDVIINCVTVGFRIGGAVSGLAGSGLVLQNGADSLAIAANGPFTMPETLPEGSPYNVTAAAQPARPTQQCTVTSGSGTVGTTDISNVAVDCVTSRFSVGGTVSGLVGIGLALRINGGETIVIGQNGSFAFPTPLPSGSSYEVTVAGQPFFPIQSCTVANGTGTIDSAPITDVMVTCSRL